MPHKFATYAKTSAHVTSATIAAKSLQRSTIFLFANGAAERLHLSYFPAFIAPYIKKMC